VRLSSIFFLLLYLVILEFIVYSIISGILMVNYIFVIIVFLISLVISCIYARNGLYSFTDIISLHNEYNSNEEFKKFFISGEKSSKIMFIGIPTFLLIYSFITFVALGVTQLIGV
jgi:hypothetical protein